MPTGPPTVLVVDDHTDGRELLAEFLAFAGFHVITASNAVDAIQLAEQHRPLVVLMDLSLPGMDGLEATRRIKRHPLLKDTVVIAVTARAFPTDKEEAHEAGCLAVFVKPIQVGEVALYVHRIIHGDSSTVS